MTTTINPDYLVIGAGAMGLAFVDTLLSDTKATVAIIDRYARPGGHWTIAYPHVTLHQPSAFYGVNSRYFPGEKEVDQVGGNKGMAGVASGDEVCAYFDKVMRSTFLPSGRVQYYPLHEYVEEGRFKSLLTKKAVQVGPETRIVNATFMKVEVPAMRPPPYKVAKDVNIITPNGLVALSRPYGNYTVVGAGKTGIDACLWLLNNGIDAKNISWIMPRDSWYINRAATQPSWSPATIPNAFQADFEAMAEASSLEDLFYRLEANGSMLRLDKNIWPTMYKCATVSTIELEQLQQLHQLKNIIRNGRVVNITPEEVTLEGGKYTPVPDTLFVDCTADGLQKLPAVPIFNGKLITLQAVRYCQQVFSAALIAHLEATYEDDETKNAMATPVSHPDETHDYIRIHLQTLVNAKAWYSQPQTRKWLHKARLDAVNAKMPTDPVEAEKYVRGQASKMGPVGEALHRLWEAELTKRGGQV